MVCPEVYQTAFIQGKTGWYSMSVSVSSINGFWTNQINAF